MILCCFAPRLIRLFIPAARSTRASIENSSALRKALLFPLVACLTCRDYFRMVGSRILKFGARPKYFIERESTAARLLGEVSASSGQARNTTL